MNFSKSCSTKFKGGVLYVTGGDDGSAQDIDEVKDTISKDIHSLYKNIAAIIYFETTLLFEDINTLFFGIFRTTTAHFSVSLYNV